MTSSRSILHALVLSFTIIAVYASPALADNDPTRGVESTSRTPDAPSLHPVEIGDTKRFGLGFEATDYSFNLSARYYSTPNMALDASIGSTFFGGVRLGLSGVSQPSILFEGYSMRLATQVGGGFSAFSGTEPIYGTPVNGFGAFAILGIALSHGILPFESTFDLRPGFSSLHGGFALDVGFAGRWFF